MKDVQTEQSKTRWHTWQTAHYQLPFQSLPLPLPVNSQMCMGALLQLAEREGHSFSLFMDKSAVPWVNLDINVGWVTATLRDSDQQRLSSISCHYLVQMLSVMAWPSTLVLADKELEDQVTCLEGTHVTSTWGSMKCMLMPIRKRQDILNRWKSSSGEDDWPSHVTTYPRITTGMWLSSHGDRDRKDGSAQQNGLSKSV